MNIDQIIQDIVFESEGSREIEWSSEYEQLDADQQQQVVDAVFNELDTCDGCGAHFTIYSLESTDTGEELCGQCLYHYEQEQQD